MFFDVNILFVRFLSPVNFPVFRGTLNPRVILSVQLNTHMLQISSAKDFRWSFLESGM